MSENLFGRGMKVRREVLGDVHVDRSMDASTAFGADFQRFVTEVAWGEVWTRPHLDRRTRHMITIAVLAALGRLDELELHVGATPNTGVSPDDLLEVFLHVAAYAGISAANAGVSIARGFYAGRPDRSQAVEGEA